MRRRSGVLPFAIAALAQPPAEPVPAEGRPLGVRMAAWGRDDALVAVATQLETQIFGRR
jgi:hypothetical protein